MRGLAALAAAAALLHLCAGNGLALGFQLSPNSFGRHALPRVGGGRCPSTRAATIGLRLSKGDASPGGAGTVTQLEELERLFEERVAQVAPALLEALNEGPGAVAYVDNVLGLEHTRAMRQEAIAVTERDILRGSASAYSIAAPKTFEERYGDEPGISAGVLTPGTEAGELTPRCRAYISAASRVLARVLGGARRGKLVHVEDAGLPTDHQLRLTTVAQQVHMDNSFDGVNKRLLTTLYYLNPDWQPEHGGRFLPWPCSDPEAADSARASELPSTVLTYDDLPAESQAQIPKNARDTIRLRISRKLAPTAEYEEIVAKGRRRQAPVEPIGDRLVCFYSDELLHSVEPVTKPPIIRQGKSVRVDEAGRFAISLWLPAPTSSVILTPNPAQEWLRQLRESGDFEDTDPIGGKLHIEQAEAGAAGGGTKDGGKDKDKGFGFGGGQKKAAKKKKGKK